jgi:glycosyltransferase involved in cell wall biosynthesis
MSKKRILFVVNHAGFFLSHRLPVALAARDAGYDVHVATPRSKHSPLIAAQLPWSAVPMNRSGRNPVSEALSVAGLYRLYRRLRPDLVHHVTIKPVLYGTIAARAAGVPAVVNALTGLGHLFVDRPGRQKLLNRAIGVGYRFAFAHRNMRLIFQNEDDRSAFVSNGWVDADSTVLIPGSGVDPDVFVPPPAEPAEPVVVLATRMLWTKGVGEFVDAARLIRKERNVRFLLVGEPDPDNPASVPVSKLQSWSQEGVVEYLGRRDDMPEIFRESSVVCLPSYYREGVPKVLIEAASAERAIVTTDTAGCRDIVAEGVNGLLVAPRNVAALAAAILRLLDDDDLRLRLGRAGRARVLNSFSIEHVLQATLKIYGELLSA